MKKLFVLPSIIIFSVILFSSCKKCQECTITTTQTVFGFEQSIPVTKEYCGDEYDNAPPEGTITQSVGGVSQEVKTECH